MEYLTMNDGKQIPVLGFGVFQIPDPQEAERSVVAAIKSGYRLIDTAAAYHNEKAVGKGIRSSGIDREKLFITTKLWVTQTGYEKTKQAVETSLRNLGLEYLDLYLIHQPFGDVYGSWRAMEELQREGKIRSIGVSNFQPDRVMDLVLYNEVAPAVNQIEINPWYHNAASVDFLRGQAIVPEAWAPFAEGRNGIFSNATLASIGQAHGKSVGQIILRWLTQRGIVALAKTTHRDRMEENFDSLDFTLSPDELDQISALDTNNSQFLNHRDPQTVKMIHDLERDNN